MKEDALRKIRAIVDYQFCPGAGEALFPDGITVKYSKRTGRAKEVYHNGVLLATLQPIYGTFTPTIKGFARLCQHFKPPKFRVAIKNEVAEIIKQGKNVFVKHVVNVDRNIRVEDEVVITDEKDEILAIGKAALSGEAMLAFKRGVAVKVRHGVDKGNFKILPNEDYG